MTRVEHRMVADTYSLMDCLDNLQDDNQAPAVVLQGSLAPGLTMEFSAAASDMDGQIGGYEWVFGDGFVAAEQSPLHTFNAPGWYLVSCTVFDDDARDVLSGSWGRDWYFANYQKDDAQRDRIIARRPNELADDLDLAFAP